MGDRIKVWFHLIKNLGNKKHQYCAYRYDGIPMWVPFCKCLYRERMAFDKTTKVYQLKYGLPIK